MYLLVIKPRAIQMMQEAYEWYESEKSGLGDTFLFAIDKVFEKVTEHPEYFRILDEKYRQVQVEKFPYVVVYEVMGMEVVVFAVFHTSRDPNRKL